MPVEHPHTIKAGATRRLLFVYASDEREPRIGMTGLANDTSTASVAFAREGESTVHRVTLTGGRLGDWTSGSFVEVDPDLMPGVYQLGEKTFRPGGALLARAADAPLLSVWVHRPVGLLPSRCVIGPPVDVTGDVRVAVEAQAARMETEVRQDPACLRTWLSRGLAAYGKAAAVSKTPSPNAQWSAR